MQSAATFETFQRNFAISDKDRSHIDVQKLNRAL